MRQVPAAFALVALVLLPGCFGDVQEVYVPDDQIPDGWSHVQTHESDGNVAYFMNVYTHEGHLLGEVYLIAVTDVPAVDEGAEVKKRIHDQAAADGVSLRETGRRQVTLDNGQVTEATEYKITKQTAAGSAEGQAWFLHWDAGDFSAGGLGWATTEHSTLLGTQSDPTAWEGAQAMLRAATW